MKVRTRSGGPQEERNKKTLAHSSSDLGVLDNREVVLPLDFHTQEQSYHRKISQLTQENDFLKSYVQRALNELKHVLISNGKMDAIHLTDFPSKINDNILPNSNTDDDSTSSSAAPWFTSEEYMNPLLSAYDIRLKELQSSHEASRKEIESFSSQTDTLARENETLRCDLNQAMEKLLIRAETSSHSIADAQSSVVNSEEVTELQERIDILMAENNLLMEQNSIQESELESARNDVTERDQQLLTMSHNFNHATTAVKNLRGQNTTVSAEKQACEVRLQQMSANAAALETERDSLTLSLRQSKKAMAELTSRLREAENSIDSLKAQSDVNQDSIASRHAAVSKRLREVMNALEAKEALNEELQESKRALSQEVETAKNDCNGMLAVLNSMEKQLVEYAAREDRLNSLEKECQSKIESALLERDQAKAREESCRVEITRLVTEAKDSASSVVAITEKEVQEVKRRLQSAIAVREKENLKLAAEIVELKHERDRSNRNSQATTVENQKLRTTLESERQALDEKFNDILRRVIAAEAEKDSAVALEASVSQKLASKTREADEKIADLNVNTTLLKDKITSLERELEVRRAELREVQHEKDEKERRLDYVTGQVAELKAEHLSALGRSQEVYQNQIIEQKNRLFSAEGEVVKLKEKLSKLETASRMEAERSVARKSVEMESLVDTNTRLREEKCRAESQVSELNVTVNELTSKIQSLQADVRDAEDAGNQLQQLLDEAERKACELSSQLSIILSKQQQQLRNEKETRTALDRTKLEKTRADREIQTLRNALQDLQVRVKEAEAKVTSTADSSPV